MVTDFTSPLFFLAVSDYWLYDTGKHSFLITASNFLEITNSQTATAYLSISQLSQGKENQNPKSFFGL